MSKTIASENEHYPGTFVLPDVLSWDQIVEIEARMDQTDKLKPGIAAFQVRYLPVVCACVEQWDIEGFPETVTPETYPKFPRKDSGALFMQVWGEIWKLYNGEADSPNG